MNYYKVKPECDQQKVITKSSINGALKLRTVLFAGELFTMKELNKMYLSEKFTPNFIKNNFDIISVSKNNTFFFFGSRKQIN